MSTGRHGTASLPRRAGDPPDPVILHSPHPPSPLHHAGHIRRVAAGAAVMDVMNWVTVRNAPMRAGQRRAWELGSQRPVIVRAEESLTRYNDLTQEAAEIRAEV